MIKDEIFEYACIVQYKPILYHKIMFCLHMARLVNKNISEDFVLSYTLGFNLFIG